MSQEIAEDFMWEIVKSMLQVEEYLKGQNQEELSKRYVKVASNRFRMIEKASKRGEVISPHLLELLRDIYKETRDNCVSYLAHASTFEFLPVPSYIDEHVDKIFLQCEEDYQEYKMEDLNHKIQKATIGNDSSMVSR